MTVYMLLYCCLSMFEALIERYAVVVYPLCVHEVDTDTNTPSEKQQLNVTFSVNDFSSTKMLRPKINFLFLKFQCINRALVARVFLRRYFTYT